jgi:hypothetical protein
MAELVIVVSELEDNPGVFQASIDGRALCISRTPFLDAARKLLAEGHNTAAVAIMRHSGSTTDCLRSSLGVAARLRVEESSLRFRRWNPFGGIAGEKHSQDSRHVPPRMRSIEEDEVA